MAVIKFDAEGFVASGQSHSLCIKANAPTTRVLSMLIAQPPHL